MKGKSRKLLRELPKVATLLAVGALVLFPMYMMAAISFMSPAQLERFPWFPRAIDVPEEIDSHREGRVSIEPAVLVLRREGAAGQQIAVPVDERFSLHVPNVKAEQTAWTVRPDDGAEAVIAELQSASVWDVRETSADVFTIDNRPFQTPEGFTSVLPGLRLRAEAQRELQVADKAMRRSKQALGATQRVMDASDETQTAIARREAVVAYLETTSLVEQTDRAVQRAEELAARAGKWRVSVAEELDSARRKRTLAGLNLDRVEGRIADYLPALKQEAEEEIRRRLDEEESTVETSALKETVFKVDRRETVALLTTDVPTEVSREGGQIDVDTRWTYPRLRRRLLRVRLHDGVEETPEGGRPCRTDAPLADLVANRDFTLRWEEGQWECEGEPFSSFVPVGFEVTLPQPPTGAEAEPVRFTKETVLATLAEPKVQVLASGETMFIGLAPKQADGSYRMPFGQGRWTYDLRRDRSRPFVIRTLDTGEGEQTPGESTTREIQAAAGEPIARLSVNRQRTVTFDPAKGKWVETTEAVDLNIPPGFVGEMSAPESIDPDKPPEKTLANGTLLAEMAMPEARATITDDFLVVSMTGSEWGDGQWEYPIGEQGNAETLQIVRADADRIGRAGPWTFTAGGAGESGEAAAPAPVLEVKAVRRATLRYVSQRWHLDGRPVDLWLNTDVLTRARDNVHEAVTRLENLRARMKESGGANLRAEEKDAVQLLAHRRRALERLEKSSAFIPLTGPGEPLSSQTSRVVVEAGQVLARLHAETPHPDASTEDPAAEITTTLAEDDGNLTVSFRHVLPFPPRANIVVADGETVTGEQKLCTFFTQKWLDTENYGEAWVYVKPFIVNTVVVAVITMIFSMFFASLAAFVFARFSFPGKGLFYAMILVLLMVPGVLNLVPLYVVVKNMGLLNSLLALILPAIAGGQVVNVYIMRNNLETLAKDLFDAAKIDGATNFQTYWHIAVPLSKPIMGTLGIFALLSQWNNFIWPWIVIKDMEKMTITAGLAKLEGQHLSDYGLQMAGAALASLPLIILFFFMMNLFIRGMQSGAIKA